VYRNLVILGNGVGDRVTYKGDPPGDVRAFDARTGRQVWRFNTVPGAGELGNDTWGNESWKTAGHTNVWAPMSLDEQRGLLYLPVSTPSNDFFGGDRPGANLFGESIVCLDAATGVRKWHFQIVHHGLWDYDPASAPSLVTMTVDGRRVDAVVQLTKQGFAFVFDRVTGRPIWPIEERAVPASDVDGEHAWPTQPIPSKPAAFAPHRHGARGRGGFHAGAARSGAGGDAEISDGAGLHAAVGHGHTDESGHHRRRELGRVRVRSGGPAGCT
jgi:quinoprotein glucose dehydrogenase